MEEDPVFCCRVLEDDNVQEPETCVLPLLRHFHHHRYLSHTTKHHLLFSSTFSHQLLFFLQTHIAVAFAAEAPYECLSGCS